MIRAIAFAALALTGAAHAQEPIAIGTSPQGTLTFSLAAAYTKVLLDAAQIQARVQPLAGTGVMVPLVNDGELDAGFVNTLEVTEAYSGTGTFKGRANPNLRMIGVLFPIKVGFFVRKDSPVKSIKDVRGRSIAYGYNAQEIIRTLVDGMLANGGMSVADVKPVPVPNLIRGADDFAAGRIDVGFFALGTAKVKEIDAQVGGLRFIPLEDSPQAVAAMRKFVPTAYIARVDPSPALTGVAEPFTTMFYDYVLFANAKLPNDRAFQLARAMAEQKQALAEAFPQYRELDPAKLYRKIEVPYHNGALQYFKEKNIALTQ
jgi:hypothetical protein